MFGVGTRSAPRRQTETLELLKPLRYVLAPDRVRTSHAGAQLPIDEPLQIASVRFERA